jgi:CyaY protein
MMTESEFLDLTDAILARIENAIDEAGLDADFTRNGGVLQLDFDSGATIVINRHEPNRELWLAARSGGFHFARQADGRWLDTRDGKEFFGALAALIASAAGEPFSFDA